MRWQSVPGTIAPFRIGVNKVREDASVAIESALTLQIRYSNSPLSVVENVFVDTEIVFSLLE